MEYHEYEKMVLKPFTEQINDESIKSFIDGIKGIKTEYGTDLSVQFLYNLIGGTNPLNRVKMSKVLSMSKAKTEEVKRTFKVRTLSATARTTEVFKFISL